MGYRFNNHYGARPQIQKVEDVTILPRLDALIANPAVGDREKTFLNSLKSGFEKYNSLTIGQFSALEKMEAQFSGNSLAAHKEWVDSFDGNKRTILMLCVEYYSRTGYFANTVKKVRDNPNYIPSEKEYRAMCENKYAKRLITNIESEAKFNPTDIVEIRKSARYLFRYEDNSCNIGTIISSEEQLDTKRGARIYHVLLFGDGGIVKINERDLKKYREKKVKNVNIPSE